MGLEGKVRAILARSGLPALERPYFEELLGELRENPRMPVSGAVLSLVSMRYDAATSRAPR